MLASAIRELAASIDPTLIAAALFQDTVQIWDLKSRTKVSEFPTVFCTGAKNLALAPLGEILVAGLSREYGKVAAYDVPSGEKVWEQRLIYPTSLRFHPSGQSILCTRNGRSILRLDTRTGEVLEVIEGARRYIEEPSGDALSIPSEKGTPFCLVGKGHTLTISELSFAILDAQFSPHSLCLSEARGPVRCVSRVDGRTQWTFSPSVGSHVLRLHYSPKMDLFFGILWDFEKGGLRNLLRFDPTSGAYERICEFDSWEEIFVESVNQLVTSAGEVRDLSNGALVDRLAFPLREYADD